METGWKETDAFHRALERITDRIVSILDHNVHSIWLYGSTVLDDFRPGWSDIDLLVLSGGPMDEERARQLAGLRQSMAEEEPDNPYYRSFEGIVADREEYFSGRFSRLVYWGTSGQRITDRCPRDVFSTFVLARKGISVYGAKDRSIFAEPDVPELREAVRAHYESIRQYAGVTDERIYSCGWLLDIARCVYTLRNNDVIAKTRAGFWALSEHLFEDEEPLKKALEIRQNPAAYKNRDDVKQWLKGLGPVVQQYADVLERELYRADPCSASSLPFRKTKEFTVPDGVTVLREDRFDATECSGTDEPYFKMVHSLGEIRCPDLPAPFAVVQCGAEDYARHIGECYPEERIAAGELGKAAFDPDLRLAVVDTATGRIAASGIGALDPGVREGTLEWIQVSPDYRRRGLGRYVVCELLRRFRGRADFVTVSGGMRNPDHPLALYRSCGFTGCVVWHVVRKKQPENRSGDD